LVIVLTKYEKKTLFSFFALYVGSVTILLAFIVVLFFNRNYENQYKQIIANMQMQAQEVCSNIVMGGMEGKTKNNFNFPTEPKFPMEYYSKNQIDTLPFKLNHGQNIYHDNKTNTIFYVEPNTKATWGIDYIILQEKEFLGNTFGRIQHCIFLFGSIYLFVIFVGYVLARYFIEPIVEQRNQLNNFIKDTTHELNTPISAIVMSISDDDTTISKKGLQRIKYSVKRITEIYSDMTYLFLEGNSSSKSYIQEYNLKSILDDQMIYFSKMAENKNQTITFDTYDTRLNIDKEDFIRLCNNLITNAIKYTPKGGTIEVILKHNKFSVKDNGVGISDEKQKRIFDRFYRASEEVGGFGIGLNIVNNICNKYYFKIDLTSAPKKGTTFSIILDSKE
jgi:two-component system OmpR family sensor kinase